MKRIDTPDNRFHNGDPATQTRGTVLADWWLNAVQEEICNVIIALGQELDPENSYQLAETLKAYFARKNHQQGWDTITDKPDAYPPAAHQQGWDTITGKPSTYPPAAHNQAWNTITGKPTTFPSSNHGHPAGEISGLSQVPTGAIIIWPDDNVPGGFLECNGAAISRSTYSGLYGKIVTRYGSGNGSSTFNLPNLRGEFVRGWDHGRGVDSGRGLGTGQMDQVGPHTHALATGSNDTTPRTALDTVPKSGMALNTQPNVGTETRPRNVAMMFCIKY